MNATTPNTNTATDNAGFPPAPPEAHQQAGVKGRYLDAVLAGLRLLQDALEAGRVLPNDGGIGDILTNAGAHGGITIDEIDALCEELNKAA